MGVQSTGDPASIRGGQGGGPGGRSSCSDSAEAGAGRGARSGVLQRPSVFPLRTQPAVLVAPTATHATIFLTV